MSENRTMQDSHSVLAAHGKGIKVLPAMAALVVIGLSLYAARAMVPQANDANQPVQGKADEAPPAQTARAVEAAKAFLASLDDKGRAKAVFDFGSPKKAGWSNLPVDFVPRNGVRLGDLTKAQRDAAMTVVAAVLSREGYQKVIDIMNADEDLKVNGGGKGKGKGKGKGGPSFGNDNFYLAIFGTPSLTEPWFVQYGGHHLGINVTIVGKNFALTPSLTCAQPDAFKRDGKTVRPLGAENDKAFALVNALNDEQRKDAILGQKPINLVLGPGQDKKVIKTEGIKGSALTDNQKTMLLDLIGQWVNIIHEDAAAIRMAEIKAKLPDTYFAWNGPTENGSAAYYRVQGPTLVIEYAPQGSTSHIHTVIRDQTNDYGQKWLKRE